MASSHSRREPVGGGIHRICQRLRLPKMYTHTAYVTIIFDDVKYDQVEALLRERKYDQM